MEKLVLKHVSCVYDGNIPALEDISFSLKAGESVCVAGANGSGKSTLLQIIASALKSSGGEIFIDGRRVTNGVHHGKTGIVFQEPDNQFFMPTVWEDVAFGVMKKGMDLAGAKAAALAALAEVDAEELADRRPYTLSGGEKQRAALASILIMKPEILLLDEPTAALDPRSRKNIISLIKNLPCARLIASHDLDMALDTADRIIFLHRGRIAADCPAPGLLLDNDF
ncbi:MAG: energy-coupling factor ABC transporter ATP-binding protein, partial [Treponema sp.]|nr:energy-coupling factor ABC transporter ATP-binding protein [Treponema sp.]